MFSGTSRAMILGISMLLFIPCRLIWRSGFVQEQPHWCADWSIAIGGLIFEINYTGFSNHKMEIEVSEMSFTNPKKLSFRLDSVSCRFRKTNVGWAEGHFLSNHWMCTSNESERISVGRESHMLFWLKENVSRKSFSRRGGQFYLEWSVWRRKHTK